MKILVLSHFDSTYGPVSYLYLPIDVNKEMLTQISELINLSDRNRDFFIHIVKGFQSANCFFEVRSPNVRGLKEILLISIILTDNNINPDLARKFLDGFINQVQETPEIYKAFSRNAASNPDCKVKYDELKAIFQNFYDSIPIENVIQNRRDAKILLFGLAKVGKTTIVKRLQNLKSMDTLPTTNVAISRLFLNNLSLMVYDVPGQMKFRTLWKPYLESQDALVFIFDITNKEKYEEASSILRDIANMDKLKPLPLLILLNKMDLETPNVKEIEKVLNMAQFKNRTCKVFSTSAVNNKGLEESFTWLTQELSKKYTFAEVVPVPAEFREGIIFSRWDEETGLELLDIFPPDAFQEPETLAIHCFSMAQFIYGGEKFSHAVSFVLPLTHLKANAAIYFDFIEKDTIRGGKLPLCLIIVLKEEISPKKIESMNGYVVAKFNEIKSLYQEETRFQKNLKDIYEKFIDGKPKPEDTIQKKTNQISKKINEFLKKF